MNKCILLKMYLRRSDRTLVSQLVYQLSGQRPKGFVVAGDSAFLRTHVVRMKAHSGDEFAVTDAEIGELYKGVPVFSSNDLRKVGELCQ